jgi:replicative DNA helicase
MYSYCKDLGGVDMVIVDYIQLMPLEQPEKSREENLRATGKLLKILALELDCPVVVLSQLSRDIEHTKESRPTIKSLGKVSSLDTQSDIVLLLYREEYYKEDTDMKNTMEVLVAKNRGGDTGGVLLSWDRECMGLRDYA